MVELTETTVATALAFLGVVGSLGWYALAWYGIRSLQDIREAADSGSPNSE